MKKVLIVAFQGVEEGVLRHLEKKIADIMGYRVVVGNRGLAVPSCRKRGDQLLAEDLFPTLSEELMKTDADLVLGVIDHDLYTEDLNFVFGLAYLNFCVISLFRLASEKKDILYLRALKEGVHELGHVSGLGHCPDPLCVMHFSNTLADTDMKGENFCRRCLDKLRRYDFSY
ncbi:MAG: archaemetzincin family Zn-dependent metalloprotease [Candidatus Methanosuratincola sp.]|jgi:archaemetzincin